MTNDMNDEDDKSDSFHVASSSSADELAHSQIGQKLRSVYDEVVNQEVPDRFLDLLNKLEQTGEQGGQER